MLGKRLAATYEVRLTPMLVWLVVAAVGIGGLAAVYPRYLLLTLLALGMVVVAIRYPRVTLFLVIVAMPLAPAIQSGTIVKYVRPDELLLLVVFLVALLRWGFSRRLVQLLPSSDVDWIWFATQAFAVVSLLAAALTRSELLNTSSYLNVVKPIQFFILYKLTASMLTDEDTRERLFHALLWSSVVVSIVGLLALRWDIVEGIVRAYYSRPGGGYFPYRASSTFDGQPDYLGTYWVFLNCIFLSRLLVSKVRTMWYVGPALILNCVGVYATLSRGALVAQLVGFVVILLLAGGRRYLIPLAGSAVLVVFWLFPELLNRLFAGLQTIQYRDLTLVREFTVGDRLTIWSQQLQGMGPNLILGLGPIQADRFYSDNQYIAKIVQFGFVGLIGFLVWLGAYARHAFRVYVLAASPERYWGLGVFAGVIAVAVQALTLEPFTSSRVAEFIWIGLAVIVSLSPRSVASS